MTMYVKINEQNKPWILDATNKQKDGYQAVYGLMDYQILALMKFPDKCFLDDAGVLHAPTDLPLSEQEKNAELVQQLQSKVDTLNEDVKSLTNERDSVKADNANLNNQIKLMQNQIMGYTKELAIVNAKLQSKPAQPAQDQPQANQGGVQ